jgi:hypothetical protein
MRRHYHIVVQRIAYDLRHGPPIATLERMLLYCI